ALQAGSRRPPLPSGAQPRTPAREMGVARSPWSLHSASQQAASIQAKGFVDVASITLRTPAGSTKDPSAELRSVGSPHESLAEIATAIPECPGSTAIFRWRTGGSPRSFYSIVTQTGSSRSARLTIENHALTTRETYGFFFSSPVFLGSAGLVSS